MTVDKFGWSPKTGQNVTNVAGVSHEYGNSNFLRKGQAMDMSGQSIVNLGSQQGPMDAVRKKYVNEKFFKRGDPIDMNQKVIKNVLSPTKESDERLRRLEKCWRKWFGNEGSFSEKREMARGRSWLGESSICLFWSKLKTFTWRGQYAGRHWDGLTFNKKYKLKSTKWRWSGSETVDWRKFFESL